LYLIAPLSSSRPWHLGNVPKPGREQTGFEDGDYPDQLGFFFIPPQLTQQVGSDVLRLERWSVLAAPPQPCSSFTRRSSDGMRPSSTYEQVSGHPTHQHTHTHIYIYIYLRLGGR
jgi:hypothetical protein